MWRYFICLRETLYFYVCRYLRDILCVHLWRCSSTVCLFRVWGRYELAPFSFSLCFMFRLLYCVGSRGLLGFVVRLVSLFVFFVLCLGTLSGHHVCLFCFGTLPGHFVLGHFRDTMCSICLVVFGAVPGQHGF